MKRHSYRTEELVPFEAVQSSTWRELEAIRFAIESFLPLIVNSELKLLTDSQSAVRVVECGSMKPHLQELAIEIFNLCLHYSIKLDINWIPRSINDQADFVSRIIDADDWSLTNVFFTRLSAIIMGTLYH